MYKIAAEYDLLLPIESDLGSTGGEFAIETGQIHPNCSIFVCCWNCSNSHFHTVDAAVTATTPHSCNLT